MPGGPSDESVNRSDIQGLIDQVSDLHESLGVVTAVGRGLEIVGGSVGDLLASLQLAVDAQQTTENARRYDAKQSRDRFWFTIGGIVVANVIVIAISVIVLVGQSDAREQSESRSTANRDRQSCATSLLVYWDEKLGNALRVTTQLPPVPRDSPEYMNAINGLNAATALIGNAKELCYGAKPNPDPVPE